MKVSPPASTLNNTTEISPPPTVSASGGTITTKDEGVTLSTSVTTLDFVGAGVTASGAGATTTVTIPGASGGSIYFDPDPPATPSNYVAWWNTEEGMLKVYYNDGNTSQWVDATIVGADGAPGTNGTNGVGVPTGGTTGQVLSKIDATNYNTQWVTPTGGSGNFTKISSVVTSGSASTITFSSIPNTYIDLLLVLTGRDTATGTNDAGVRMKINSDGTAGNYSDTQYLLGQAATASANNQSATTDGQLCCQIPGSSGNANAVGGGRILIPNYAGTTFHKVVMEDSWELHSGGPSLLKIQRGFVWKSTAAISSIVLKAGATAFVDGTTATLYGMG